MTLEELRAHDPADMYSAILGFPRQAREGVEIGNGGPKLIRGKARRIVILGMGGSAIGGDLLRSYVHSFAEREGVEVVVNRSYTPPAVDGKTLLVASSYSGNTEETLASYEGAWKAAGQVLVISTGGEIVRRATANGHKVVIVPAGLQPRAALGYSFFPLLYTLAVRSELFGTDLRLETERGLEELLPMLEKLAKKYALGPAGSKGGPYQLAEQIHGHVPVIYSASERMDTVNLRWRGQIQENAKNLAFGNLLPEMNHNEINGWQQPAELVKSFLPIFLRDREDHPRVAARMEITRKIVGKAAAGTIEVKSQGETLLARMFSLIHLGDWTSYYLALLNGVDPMPVPIIENLKKQLAKR